MAKIYCVARNQINQRQQYESGDGYPIHSERLIMCTISNARFSAVARFLEDLEKIQLNIKYCDNGFISLRF